MAKRPKFNFDALERRVLCFLHYRFAHSVDIAFTAEELTDTIPDSSLNTLGIVLNELNSEGAVEDTYYDTEEGEQLTCYNITKRGIEVVDGWSDDLYADVANGIDFSAEEPSRKSAGSVGQLKSNDEDSDIWEPLPIDRGTPEFEAAVEATEAAALVVENDNGYAVNEPGERGHIVDSLKVGLEWIKEGAPSLAQVRATVLAPLKFLASKFSGAAMGEAAKVAVAKVVAWLASIM